MMAIDGKMMIHRFMGKAYFQKPLGRRFNKKGPRFASFGVEAAIDPLASKLR